MDGGRGPAGRRSRRLPRALSAHACNHRRPRAAMGCNAMQPPASRVYLADTPGSALPCPCTYYCLLCYILIETESTYIWISCNCFDRACMLNDTGRDDLDPSIDCSSYIYLLGVSRSSIEIASIPETILQSSSISYWIRGEKNYYNRHHRFIQTRK